MIRRAPGCIVFFWLAFAFSAVQAQYALERDTEVSVQRSDGSVYLNPWAGGLNNVQVSSLQLNEDTLFDLLVFDKAGGRWLCFEAVSSGDGVSFPYAPQWVEGLPKLSALGLARDYDNDGDPDLFSYNGTSLTAWQGLHVESGNWEFALYNDGKALRTERDGIRQDLRMTGGDVPGILDLDGDSDLDILLVDAAGAYVEWHRNQSQELYGHSDSLRFILQESCWGRFRENPSDDGITLDTCSGMVPVERWNTGTASPSGTAPPPVHTGSSLCPFDLNRDEVIDLLIGDIGGSRLGYLRNGAFSDDADMITHEPNWPAADVPVMAPLFPAAFPIDADGNGRDDILVAPQDRGFSGNYRHIQLYRDTATSGEPVFVLDEIGFLQNTMLDVGEISCPAWLDADGDGDADLVVGNGGYRENDGEARARLMLVENLGGSPVQFRVADPDYATLSALPEAGTFASPAFADLDGDGDQDMVLGRENGQLGFFRNVAPAGSPASFSWESWNWQGIDAGSFSMPAFADLNADGLPDLLVGERNGNLNYYRNTGTLALPVFTLIDENWGGISVADNSLPGIGFSSPFVWTNAGGGIDLLVGSLSGKLWFYRDVYESGLPFTASDSLFAGKPDGERIKPCFTDWTGDGLPDLILGNLSGGLQFFRGTPGSSGWVEGPSAFPPAWSIAPNPSYLCFQLVPPESGTFSGMGAIVLLDAAGRVVWQETIAPHDPSARYCPDLTPGTYWLKLPDGSALPWVKLR